MKIWYIADAWRRLAVDGDSPQSMMSMMIHRMTGCKETTSPLSRASFGSSYTTVSQETKKLADDARNDSRFTPATIPKGQPTRFTLNNSDGRQQTLTGLPTTRHTNSTIYLPILVTHPAEDANAESSTENMDL